MNPHLTLSRSRAFVCAVTAIPGGFWGELTDPACAQGTEPDERVAYQIEPPLAWNRTDRYEAPNYEAFFPNDAEAGRLLD
jgi:hypothetical protein